MSAEETPSMGAMPQPEPYATPQNAPAVPEPADVVHVAGTLHAADLQANLAAVGTATAQTLSATGSAVGVASVEGDATVTASMVALLRAKGSATVQQSYASALIVGGDMEIHQAGAPIIVGKKIDINQGGGGVLVTGEANVRNGFVGVVLSPKTTVSEDSRVLISTRAALIIAGALLGGFGLVAVVMALGVRRVMSWRPQINVPQMPDFSAIAKRVEQYRRHAA
jgi:hypothetical protein